MLKMVICVTLTHCVRNKLSSRTGQAQFDKSSLVGRSETGDSDQINNESVGTYYVLKMTEIDKTKFGENFSEVKFLLLLDDA